MGTRWERYVNVEKKRIKIIMSHVMNFLANFISTTASIHDNDDRVEVTFQRNLGYLLQKHK